MKARADERSAFLSSFILPPSSLLFSNLFQVTVSAPGTRDGASSMMRRKLRMKTFRLRSFLTLPLVVAFLLTTATFTESSAQRRRQPSRKTLTGTALFVVSRQSDSDSPKE